MKPMVILGARGENPPKAELYYGCDVRTSLQHLPEASIQCVCTSPPYWGLRDYGCGPSVWGGEPECEHDWAAPIPQDSRHRWTSGNSTKEGVVAAAGGYPKERGTYCQKCGAWRGQLGLEPTPQLFVEHLVEVFREIRRVLRPDGVVWLNLGDSYCGPPKGNPGVQGNINGGKRDSAGADIGASALDKSRVPRLKPKDMAGIPWRVAFGLQDDGWYLRQDIIWAKNAVMPESIQDRCTRAHEYIFMLTKESRYFYDADAIREPHKDASLMRYEYGLKQVVDERAIKGTLHESKSRGIANSKRMGDFINSSGRNKRSVWMVNPQRYRGSHFAVWPEKLVEPMVQAGSSEYGACAGCGAPYQRVVEKKVYRDVSETRDMPKTPLNVSRAGWREGLPPRTTIGWKPTCECSEDLGVTPCTVLDPFSGSATTGAVALQLGRNYVGLDIQDEYLELAKARLEGRKAPKPNDEPDLIEDLFGLR